MSQAKNQLASRRFWCQQSLQRLLSTLHMFPGDFHKHAGSVNVIVMYRLRLIGRSPITSVMTWCGFPLAQLRSRLKFIQQLSRRVLASLGLVTRIRSRPRISPHYCVTSVVCWVPCLFGSNSSDPFTPRGLHLLATPANGTDKVVNWFPSVHAVSWDISTTGPQRASLRSNAKSDGVCSVIPSLMLMLTMTPTTSSGMSGQIGPLASHTRRTIVLSSKISLFGASSSLSNTALAPFGRSRL